MAVDTRHESELEHLEELAAENLDSEHLADVDAAVDVELAREEAEVEDTRAYGRVALAVACPTLATAVMAGGVFAGAAARANAAVAGLLGVGLAFVASKIKRAVVSNAVIVVGLFAIGLLFAVPTGQVTRVGALVREAAEQGNVLRPPVPFVGGWKIILGWLLGAVGFGATWTATTLRRPSLGLLVPLPIAAIAAISVPEAQQLASGLVALVLFAIGLGLLSTTQNAGPDDARPPASYEIRRAMKALPLIAAITLALYLLAQTNVLFPKPLIDPAQEAKKPKTQPLSEVEDRVLFTVVSKANGPWRMGSLDVYDGEDWRLPPFSQSKLNEVPKSGIVDDELTAGIKAEFTVRGLGGAVLPGLPNTVGIVASGPLLSYDERNGNIRVTQGQVREGLTYTVTAAALPTVTELRGADSLQMPSSVDRFLDMPEPPPAVQDLLRRAPKDSKWDTLDFLVGYVRDEVTVTGEGTPVSITTERVQDILAGAKEASPFEFVATQAMLARWAGIPSRIGYGFDKGEVVEGGALEVRPRHGATFLEVYFPGYKWLPLTLPPKKAKATVGNTGQQQSDPRIVPSDEIEVQLFVPVVVAPADPLAENIKRAVLYSVLVAALLALAYFTWPALWKAVVRSRNRTRAQSAGPHARIALAYSEWRDMATDFGYRHSTDTPLMFLERFSPDDEHRELAWLVTRALWGDLRDSITPEDASIAEELARSLKKRLAEAHPGTVRAVAAVSRLSLRHPYSTDPLFVQARRLRLRRLRAALRKERPGAAVQPS